MFVCARMRASRWRWAVPAGVLARLAVIMREWAGSLASLLAAGFAVLLSTGGNLIEWHFSGGNSEVTAA